MKLIKYRFSVDADVAKKYPMHNVAFLVNVYLNDPHGWASKGYVFEEVHANENVFIRMSLPKTIHSACGDGNLSCAELGGKHMYLNAKRWIHGAAPSKLSLDNYRQYMVSHEIGHILGYDHAACPCVGCKAPIMMQQTLGIGSCKPNTKV